MQFLPEVWDKVRQLQWMQHRMCVLCVCCVCMYVCVCACVCVGVTVKHIKFEMKINESCTGFQAVCDM